MGNLIKKPSEMQGKRNIAVLIYGQPGAGKTTLGESAPTPVLFDYDQGAYRTNGAHQVPTFSPQSWEQTAQAIDEILQEMPECETVIIDTVGKMLDYMSEYIVRTDPKKAKLDGSLSLPGYGTRKQMFIDFIHRMQMLGKNVVFVAHEREEKRGEETVKRPEIGGSSANDLIKELDLVGYVQMIGSERTISFNPTEQFYAKNTCNLEPFMKLPVTVDRNGVAVGNNDFMAKIIDRFRTSQEAKAKLTADFDRLVADINERVEACETADDLNTLAAEFGAPEFGHIYNSKLLAGQALRDKAAALGAKFNKVKKCYEGPEPAKPAETPAAESPEKASLAPADGAEAPAGSAGLFDGEKAPKNA